MKKPNLTNLYVIAVHTKNGNVKQQQKQLAQGFKLSANNAKYLL